MIVSGVVNNQNTNFNVKPINDSPLLSITNPLANMTGKHNEACQTKTGSFDGTHNVLNIIGMSQPFYSGNRVIINVGNTQLEAIIDTGSPYSLISKKLIYNVPELSKYTLQKSNAGNLFGASGDPLIILGMLNVTVRLGEHDTQINLHIIKRLPCDLILGQDYIEATKLKLDYSTHEAIIPKTYQVKLIGDIAISPNTNALVKGKVINIDQEISEFGIFSTVDILRKCKTACKTNITHIQDKQITILIHNADTEIMYLSDNDFLGSLTLIKADVMVYQHSEPVLSSVSQLINTPNSNECKTESSKICKSVFYTENVPNHVSYNIDFKTSLSPIKEEDSNCLLVSDHLTFPPDLVYDNNDSESPLCSNVNANTIDLWQLNNHVLYSHEQPNYDFSQNYSDYHSDQNESNYFNTNMSQNFPDYNINYEHNDPDILELPWEVKRIKPNFDTVSLQERISLIETKVNSITDFNLTQVQKQKLNDILLEYQDAISFHEQDMGKVRGYRAVLRLKPHNIFSVRPYTLSPFLKLILDTHIDKLLEKNIIEPSNSPYSHGIFLQPKGTARGKTQAELNYADFRVLSDLRILNNSIIIPPHPIPNISDLMATLSMATSSVKTCVYSVFDLDKGYYQVPLAPRSKIFTGFKTPRGVFQWCVLPQGLSASPSTFCKIVYKILSPLINKGVLLSYLDDLILFNLSIDDHIETLSLCLHRLALYGIKIKLSKMQLMTSNCQFLGFNIKNRSVTPLEHKIKALLDVPIPHSRKCIKKFLGICQYYAKYVPEYSKLAEPLYKTLRGYKFKMTDEALQGFLQLKEKFAKNISLMLPDFNRDFVVYTDSSSSTISSILAQPYPEEGVNIEKPLSFDSKLLRNGDLRMTIAYKELKAVVHALKTYQKYLQYTKFKLKTDNTQVISLIKGKSYDLLPNKIARWVHFINEFSFDIEYVPTSKNISDFFTRLTKPDQHNSMKDNANDNPVCLVHNLSNKQLEDHFILAVNSIKLNFSDFSDNDLDGNELSNLFHENSCVLQSNDINHVMHVNSASQCNAKASMDSKRNFALKLLKYLVFNEKQFYNHVVLNVRSLSNPITQAGSRQGDKVIKQIYSMLPLINYTVKLLAPKLSQCNAMDNSQVLAVTRSMLKKQERANLLQNECKDSNMEMPDSNDYQPKSNQSAKQSLSNDPKGDNLQNIIEHPLELDASDVTMSKSKMINPTASKDWGPLNTLIENYFPTGEESIELEGKIIGENPIPKYNTLRKHVFKRDLQNISLSNNQMIKQWLKDESTITVDKWEYAQFQDKSLTPIIMYLKDNILPVNKKQARTILAEENNYILVDKLLFRVQKPDKATGKHSVQLVVPNLFKPAVTSLYHQSIVGGHRGGLKCYLTMRQKYFFKGMSEYIQNYCKSCPLCQKFRTGRPSPNYPLKPSTIYPGAFKSISMDIITGLPQSSYLYHDKILARLIKNGKGKANFTPTKFTALLVIICDFTRYLVTCPLEDMCIETIFHHFVQFMLTHKGLVTAVRTDNGANLIGNLFKLLYKRLGIKHITTTPAVPRANGKVERANGLILNSLKSYLKSKHKDWVRYIPFITNALNNSVNHTTNYSPAELVWGHQPNDFFNIWGKGGPIDTSHNEQTLGEFFQHCSEMRDVAHTAHLQSQKVMAERYNKQNLRDYRFSPGDLIYLKTTPKTTSKTKGILKYKLLPKFCGPYRILKVHPDKNFPIAQLQNIHTGEVLKSWYNFTNLKYAYSRAPVTVDQQLYEFPEGFPAPREDKTPGQIIAESENPVLLTYKCVNYDQEIEKLQTFFPLFDIKCGQFKDTAPKELSGNNTVHFLIEDPHFFQEANSIDTNT